MDDPSAKPETIKKPQPTTSSGDLNLASPITKFYATEATPGHINLNWENVDDASDYKLYWDMGES